MNIIMNWRATSADEGIRIAGIHGSTEAEVDIVTSEIVLTASGITAVTADGEVYRLAGGGVSLPA